MAEKFREFIASDEPVYVNDNLKISFDKASLQDKCPRAKHIGWGCLSYYQIDAPELGYYRIVGAYQNHDNQKQEEGLFLSFTHATFAAQEYLVVQVSDDYQSLIVKEDDHKRAGTVLTLVK